MQAFIEANREEIAELCRTHHVRRLSVFRLRRPRRF